MILQHLEQHFNFLDTLPDTLYDRVVTLGYGTLQQRVEGVLYWRDILLAGQLPELQFILWPEKSISETIIERLTASGLVECCRDQESLVDHIIIEICLAIESATDQQDPLATSLFADLMPPSQVESVRSKPPIMPEPHMDSAKNENPNIHEKSYFEPWENSFNNPSLKKEFDLRLSSMLDKWQEIDNVFQDMGVKMGRGWDLSKGILVSSGWKNLRLYRNIIRNNPLLKEITDSIGRSFVNKDCSDFGTNKIITDLQSDKKECKRIKSQDLQIADKPMSTQGITRSDDIARMLPQEAAYLGHPRLHMLWHAKRSESTLLSYQVEGVLSQHRPEIQQVDNVLENSKKTTANSKGPIIMCIDTSASMHGKPEIIAKAVALEVLRLAIEQNRLCYLIAFSGPGQIIEHTLEFSKKGLKALIKFLQMSFFGGTEILEPIFKALTMVNIKKWNQADILLISDGRIPDLGDKLKNISLECQRHGTNIYAIVIGRWSSHNLEKFANPVYRFDDCANLHSAS